MLDGRTTGTATLSWDDADAEGLASDRIEYTKVFGTNFGSTCACARDGDLDFALDEHSLGMSQVQTFYWSLPTAGQGCYCVRGTVTDSAGLAELLDLVRQQRLR